MANATNSAVSEGEAEANALLRETAEKEKGKINWPYPVGQLGEKWNAQDKEEWFRMADNNAKQGRYQRDVLDRIQGEAGFQSSSSFNSHLEVVKYGELSYNGWIASGRFPLLLVRTPASKWDTGKMNVLVTGGVHGYEESGVKGALMFLESYFNSGDNGDNAFLQEFNFVIAPCVAPWGYECIQRWTPGAVDPNRSFIAKGAAENDGRVESRSEEAAALMDYLDDNILASTYPGASGQSGRKSFALHLDLHETTDTDVTEFIPAKNARNGLKDMNWKDDLDIPDGFYLVGDDFGSDATVARRKDCHDRILEDVRAITLIKGDDPDAAENARSGKNKTEYAKPVGGSIFVPVRNYGTCSSLTLGGADDASNEQGIGIITEVYPDTKPNPIPPDTCCRAQMHAVRSAIEFLRF